MTMWRCDDVTICNTIQDNAMLKLSWKFGKSKWNPYWAIVLTSYSDTNYFPNEHEDFDQYGSFAISSELLLCQSHPESLVNQNEIPIELSCQRAHLALNKSLTSMKI